MLVAVIISIPRLTVPSKATVPFFHDEIEMVKDELANPPQPRREIERPFFLDLVGVGHEPELTFSLSLSRVYVHWLIPLIGVEKQPPASCKDDCWHASGHDVAYSG